MGSGSPEVADKQVTGSKVTNPSFENSFLGTGLPQTDSFNVNKQTDKDESFDSSIEDLSRSLENSHISGQTESSDRNELRNTSDQTVLSEKTGLDDSNSSALDSTFSSIGKNSVFNENYSENKSLVDEDINMESARELESRMSMLEETHVRVQEKISNLEHENRRGSVKRGRDIDDDDLDRSAEGIKTQRMSDTLLVRGRPKGSTNEVQLKKLEDDRQNRDKDRKDRYSYSDVLTRRVAKLLKN